MAWEQFVQLLMCSIVVLGGGLILITVQWRRKLFIQHHRATALAQAKSRQGKLTPTNTTKTSARLPRHTAYLVVMNGLQRGKRYAAQTHLAIGRHSQNHIVLAERQVSRFHARLDYVAPSFILTPLTQAPIFVNGRRIYGAVPLRHKHYILIGSTALLFRRYPNTPPRH